MDTQAQPRTQLSDWLTPVTSWATTGTEQETEPESGLNICGVSAVSGASTWSRLLGLEEATLEDCAIEQSVLVARSTQKSLAAVMDILSEHHGSPALVLVVADAPGKYPPPVRNQIKILAGAQVLREIPWIPALRGLDPADGLPESKEITKTIKNLSPVLDQAQ